MHLLTQKHSSKIFIFLSQFDLEIVSEIPLLWGKFGHPGFFIFKQVFEAGKRIYLADSLLHQKNSNIMNRKP